jgi:Skp family chaperone for outer membrane proteins
MKPLLLRTAALLLLIPVLAACQSAYYEAAEKVGYHKRDILVDRVEDSRDAQLDAEEQFQSALEQLSALTNFDGGDLEKMYNKVADEYEDADEAAAEVRERIDGVEDVAEALFEEWETEIGQYSSAKLKADSQAKLRETKARYDGMITAMRRSEAKMDPVLAALHDNVLYLKHNLNARAVASLKVELGDIEQDIKALIQEMRKSIDASNAFIDTLQ